MKNLPEGIIKFFNGLRFSIVSTIDRDGSPHNSCKGIVDMEKDGKVYLLDLYMARTYENLKANPHISVTAVDEHKFMGYCL
ncbi:MAG: pyridoxamine 5'-phosphate oxidase family protein, partial [Candidatus Omnitrophica bacterium]|nr:pyridoxamine 5'-phosphate oxidase family protein [Candidatus Omnitrophota bacterium]